MTVESEMSRQIAYLPYRRSFRRPLRTAHGEWAVREGFIVCIEENGRIGYGEVAPIPDFGTETVAEAGAFLQGLVQTPNLAIPDDLPCCAFAVSAALAMSRDTSAQASVYPVSALLPAGANAIEQLRQKSALGYQNFKWKIGVEPVEAELGVFQQLISFLPASAQIRLDANASLDEPVFSRWLDAISAVANQVEYIEQPLAVGQELLMAELMASSGVSIALDESLNVPQGARWINEWTGPLVVKPTLMGDVTKLQSQFEPFADRVVLSSVFETGIGMVNALRLADQMGVSKHAIGFDTLEAFGDTLQPFTSAPQLTRQHVGASQLDQLWQALLHSI